MHSALEQYNKRPLWAFVVFIIAIYVAAAIFLFQQADKSFFLFDDLPNFYGLGFVNSFNDSITYLVDGPAGTRWLSYASFLLHIKAWHAQNASAFKILNVALHIFNSVLVFTFFFQFFKQQHFKIPESVHLPAAIIITAMWFSHPIHVGTTLYSVQRMTLLAATFTLAGLNFHLWFSARYNSTTLSQWFFYSVILGLITALGVLGKENAVLLPLVVFLIACHTQRLNLFTPWQWIITSFIPIIAVITWLVINQRLGYGNRHFDMAERLLSQVVILQEYLFKIIIPRPNSFSLFYDDFSVVRHAWDIRFIQATLLWLALFTIALFSKRMAPILIFALLWFFVNHLLESTIIPLELYFDHRNYIPSLGIIAAVVVGMIQLYLYFKNRSRTAMMFAVIFLTVILSLNILVSQYRETLSWQSHKHFVLDQAKKHPQSLRVQQSYIELLFSEGYIIAAMQALEKLNRQHGVSANNLLHQVLATCLLGQDNTLNHDAIIADLKVLPFDINSDSALKSLMDSITKKQCQHMDLTVYRQYNKALLSNPLHHRHHHNYAFLLVMSLIHEEQYDEALYESLLLPTHLRTRQYWFLQLQLSIARANVELASELYTQMLASNKVNRKLYHNELMEFEKHIEQLRNSAVITH